MNAEDNLKEPHVVSIAGIIITNTIYSSQDMEDMK